MAGTARTAPAITPLATSWTSLSITSGLYLDDLAAANLIDAKLDLDDIADVAELARAGCTEILDLVAGGDRFQPIERVVRFHAAVVVGNLADVVADGGAARLAGLGHGENRKIGVIVGLADVGIERIALDQGLEAIEAGRSCCRHRLDGVDAFCRLLAGRFDELRRHAVREADDLVLEVGAEHVL